MSESQKSYTYFEPGRVANLRNINLLARQAVEGFITGLHRSPHKGFSVEFAERREYCPGDDLRHMDWVAWARSDRYYVKQYEQETNLRAHILLDVSGSMGYRHGGTISKFTYGCFLAACLSYLMTRQQDAVGMIAFDETVRFQLPPGATPAHLDRLFKQLEGLAPGGQTAIAPTFHQLADTIAKRGLIIIISDLYDEPGEVMKALQHFAHKRHQIIVFHLLDQGELELPFEKITSLVDMETGEKLQVDPRDLAEPYQREMAEFINNYRRQCSDRNIEYVQTTTTEPYDRMLLHYLARRKSIGK